MSFGITLPSAIGKLDSLDRSKQLEYNKVKIQEIRVNMVHEHMQKVSDVLTKVKDLYMGLQEYNGHLDEAHELLNRFENDTAVYADEESFNKIKEKLKAAVALEEELEKKTKKLLRDEYHLE